MESKSQSIIKYIAEAVAVILMTGLFVWAWCDMYYSETEDPDIPSELVTAALIKDIYLDGKLYNNWELKRPVVNKGSRVYLPVDDQNRVSLETEGRQENDLQNITLLSGYHYETDGVQLNLNDALFTGGSVSYIAADVLKDFGFCDSYISNGGLYISTDDTPAEEYCKANTNESYVRGRVLYMQARNPLLSDYDAYRLEYFIRHAAATTRAATPDLLISVVRMESNFNADIGTRTVGLMQVMLKYAQRKGYTYEMLCDPHINLHYGAQYISDRLEYFDGDEVKSLAAYNQGLAALLLSGDYNSAYADRILSSKRAMLAWLRDNGYSLEFVDNIILNKAE